MPSTLPWHYSSVGLMTVGTGVESSGEINVSEYQSWGRCVEYALSKGSGVVLLRGVHNALGDSFVNVVGEGKQIILAPGAEVRNCTTGTNGCFKLNSARQLINFAGGKINVNRAVANQRIIEIGTTAHWAKIQGAHIDVTASDGSGSNPISVIYGDSSIELAIEDFVCNPNNGVRVFDVRKLSGATFHKIRVRTETNDITTGRRGCYEVFRSQASRHMALRDFQILGLGTLTTAELNECVFIQGDPTVTVPEGDLSILDIEGLKIDWVLSPRFLSLWGVVSANIRGLRFGNSGGAMAVNGEAGIFITSEDDSDTSANEDKICGSIKFDDAVFESGATASANHIYVRDGKKIDFAGFHFHTPVAPPTSFILINEQRARVLKFDDMHFDGDGSTSLWGLSYENQATPPSPKGVVIAEYRESGMLYGICPGREPAAGYGSKSLYDEGSIIPVVNLSGGSRQPVVDNTGGVVPALTNVMPQTTALTGTASGSANYAGAFMARRLNGLNRALGYFQVDITDSTSGASPDGTIAAVTNAATFNDGMRELLTKYNELVGLPQSQAGKLKLFRTLAGGPAASAAAASGATTPIGAAYDYTSAGVVSAANADNSINDASTAFPAFAANDLILMQGFTTAANNRLAIVVSRTTSKIVVSNLNGNAALANETPAAGAIRIRSMGPSASGIATATNTVGTIAQLVDNSGGTPSLTGTIAAVTDAATGANLIATLALILNTQIAYIWFKRGSAITSAASL